MENEFKVDDPVIVYGSHDRVGRLEKIYKVYKNGNFILSEGGGQYRPNGCSTGQWSHGYVELATKENLAKRFQRHNEIFDNEVFLRTSRLLTNDDGMDYLEPFREQVKTLYKQILQAKKSSKE